MSKALPAADAAAIARRLTALLAAETAALQALDFARSGALLAEKNSLAEALAAALRAAAPAMPLDDAMVRTLAEQAAINRRELSRALRVQRRVLELVQEAARAQQAPPGYVRRGDGAADAAAAAGAPPARAMRRSA